MAINKNKEVIFIYSQMQESEETKINQRLGKVFECGTVSTGSNNERYSCKIDADQLSQITGLYPDAKIVARGIESQMTFTNVRR